MSSWNVAPDAQTFRILLEAVSKSGRLQSSLEVFNEMKALGIQPKTATFNMLLEACGTASQPDVSESGQTPRTSGHVSLTLTCAFRCTSQSAKAWELFEELQKSPPALPNAETLQLLLTASFKVRESSHGSAEPPLSPPSHPAKGQRPQRSHEGLPAHKGPGI